MNRYLALIVCAAVLTASCGSSDSDSPDIPVTPDMPTRIAAAHETANQNSSCTQIRPFYFEIGNALGNLMDASVGDDSYSATTPMNIASGTKWLFGAYVTEVRGGVLSTSDIRATRMQSGYVSMGNACGPSMTVSSCFAFSSNSSYTPSSLDRFHYGSGHFQKWGVDNGLASMNAAALAVEFARVLGSDINVGFSGPLLAGGAVMSAEGYAVFLRKILNTELQIGNSLGAQSTCTHPGTCVTTDYSPVPEAWSYSAGHWIEDDPMTGDGSFSSPGAFGFYPWIDDTRTYYGVLARADTSPGAAQESVECGREIRRAFMTGVTQ